MQTRREKYSKYREEILHTPEAAFPDSKKKAEKLLKEDEELLSHADSPSVNISYGDILPSKSKKKQQGVSGASPYEFYIQKKRRIFLIELGAFTLVCIGMVLLYFFWVR